MERLFDAAKAHAALADRVEIKIRTAHSKM